MTELPGSSVPSPTAHDPGSSAELVNALVLLTVLTGVVDAVCFLGLGHVFTANMTGNVIFLGFGLAHSAGLPVIAPIVSLICFLAGAFAGGRLAAALAGRGRRRWLTAALAAELTVLIAATAFSAGLSVHNDSSRRYLVIALLAVAFGLQNATVRQLAVADLRTTVLTTALTGLVADLWTSADEGQRRIRRVSSIAAIAGGAFVGALMLRINLLSPLVVAVLIAIAATVLVRRSEDV